MSELGVTTPEDICNLALDALKQAVVVNDISSPVTLTEKVCARHYDVIRRECLFAHPWKFAITRTQLEPTGTPPPFGYLYAYDVPDDYIRLITVGDDYIGDLKSAFEVESNQLLAVAGDVTFDGTTKDVRYMKNITDVTKFSPGFVVYFYLRLAIRMSNKFSVAASLKKDLKEDFEDARTEARAVNGQESKIKRIQQSKTLMKRRGLPGGLYADKFTKFET